MLIKSVESDNTYDDKFAVSERPAGLRGRKREAVRLRLTPRIVERFQSKIKRGSEGECWPWQAGCYANGYGMFNAGRDAHGVQATRYAHRVAFQLATGIDPDGWTVMHSCDNPPCCNPGHLSLGTQTENVRDGVTRGRYNVVHPGARRLTDEQVHLIRTLPGTGAELGRRFGVTRTTVSLIRRGLRRAA